MPGPDEHDAVDLFAGPGGWTEGARLIGLTDHGIETCPDACRTRTAAGHATTRADVTTIDPARWHGTPGLIASPPCQTFSAAGKRAGSALVGHLADLASEGRWTEPAADDGALFATATRTDLVLEPVRWITALTPEWITLEQVPDVLPIWHGYAHWLTGLGYSTWVGILHAERYGVPQTRRRAILIASRSRAVTEPPATHQRYRHGEPAWPGPVDGIRPWVSMAEALGWGMNARPYPTIAPGTGTGGPDSMGLGASSSRALVHNERAAGRWLNTGRDWPEGGTRADAQTITDDRPAPTLSASGQWQWTRPATTVVGDSRLWPPGHKVNADDRARLGDDEAANRYADRAGSDAIRLTVREALILQSFRPDYPVTGTKTKQFEQIGNAVPPLLAAHVLAMATGRKPPHG